MGLQKKSMQHQRWIFSGCAVLVVVCWCWMHVPSGSSGDDCCEERLQQCSTTATLMLNTTGDAKGSPLWSHSDQFNVNHSATHKSNHCSSYMIWRHLWFQPHTQIPLERVLPTRMYRRMCRRTFLPNLMRIIWFESVRVSFVDKISRFIFFSFCFAFHCYSGARFSVVLQWLIRFCGLDLWVQRCNKLWVT